MPALSKGKVKLIAASVLLGGAGPSSHIAHGYGQDQRTSMAAQRTLGHLDDKTVSTLKGLAPTDMEDQEDSDHALSVHGSGVLREASGISAAQTKEAVGTEAGHDAHTVQVEARGSSGETAASGEGEDRLTRGSTGMNCCKWTGIANTPAQGKTIKCRSKEYECGSSDQFTLDVSTKDCGSLWCHEASASKGLTLTEKPNKKAFPSPVTSATPGKEAKFESCKEACCQWKDPDFACKHSGQKCRGATCIECAGDAPKCSDKLGSINIHHSEATKSLVCRNREGFYLKANSNDQC